MNDNDDGYVVCGWYTPGYAERAATLVESLIALGEPHDFVAVPDEPGGWERATMRKPGMIQAAMDRHSRKAVVFLDVDCVAFEPLRPLARTRADIAVHLIAGRRSRGYGRLFGRTTTMVFRPTQVAHDLVNEWVAISANAPPGYVDQHTLTEAIARTSGLVIENLDARWCAMTKDEVERPAIVHTGAARYANKMPGWRRVFHLLTYRARVASYGATSS